MEKCEKKAEIGKMEIQKLAYFIQFCEDEDYVKNYKDLRQMN